MYGAVWISALLPQFKIYLVIVKTHIPEVSDVPVILL